MEDQRRPSHAAGYPASADTKRGGNLAAADTEGGRALAAARRAQRRLGLREKPARTKRNPASADSRGRRSSPPPTRSSDVPRDIRPQPTWRAAGPSPPTRSSDAPRDIQALSTPTAAGRRLPQGGPSAVSASGKASAHRGKSGLCRRWRPPGLAAADEKFGRSAGYSATTDLEGRRPFAAVKRD
ncbi:hypothetical protein HRG_007161 [Hirsutella rhossiliensis]|uniref:Uncharacterized protein n=1 Tax=Hirsutella rhossiliensis TaxID=111463 RepID=A0A9P8MXH2_9HYPO|nr:uncharacterized protein HRG_07161 [Hirsutella rhossiliensis]KAH0962081.1 hypothetical protein HRG_07161 [Hirsutella rhossiliensis]